MSEITQDKLWRLHELVQKKCRGMTHYHVNTMDGSVSLSGNGAGVYDTTSIDSAIDYLDPPKPPTYDELINVLVDMRNHSHIFDRLPVAWRKRVGEITARNDRAKAARRDSMFDTRGDAYNDLLQDIAQRDGGSMFDLSGDNA